jgi:hypothetical protein
MSPTKVETMTQETTRGYVSAKFLLAEPPPAETVLPAYIRIKRLPEGKARGIAKRKGGAILGTTSPRSAFTKF